MQCALVNGWSENDYIPQQIVSSSAVRAKQTTELVVENLTDKQPDKIIFDEELYLASLDKLVEIINAYKDGLNSLMIVAHNPGLEQLLYYLTRNMIGASTTMTVTTANLMIFAYPENASEIIIDRGDLLEFVKPKELD